jgi:D-beta-D-heptose 7-phosphate kinase/D-beta-D-heptose 1-phosphate adenosyltransferase
MSKKGPLTKKQKKPIIVAVSGGFDPVHIGHVRMFKEAKSFGDKLIVILNNDNWLKKKKGYAFMPQKERKEIIENIKWVDKVVYTKHKKNPEDMSVAKELAELKPDIFANGGDRKKGNTPEGGICLKYGIKMAFNVGHGGKVQSSSWLLQKYKNKSS